MTTSPATGDDLPVLHALRCLGFTEAGRVAEATGRPADEVESTLIDLAVAGLVTRTPGAFGGWGLTDAGRAEDAHRVGAELDAAGARDAVTAAYDAFLVLNPELLDLCTAWQMRSVAGVVVPNEHDDTAYDGRVLDRFADFHARAETVCADLAAALPRFDRYRARLGRALTRARSGEIRYVTDDMEAYHTIWFQLHEDLLVTLGIPR
ncbi:MAG: transcriptional regulator [Nonomuraea sp.]|nr:transcriptional regulator [Nonomuraea sp.]